MQKSVLIILCFRIINSEFLIGFDCGSATSNVTTISLTNVPNCNIEKPKVETTNEYIALLQLKEYEKLTVYQCLIEISRQVQSCNGFFNYVKPIERAEESFILEVSKELRKHSPNEDV